MKHLKMKICDVMIVSQQMALCIPEFAFERPTRRLQWKGNTLFMYNLPYRRNKWKTRKDKTVFCVFFMKH